MFYIAHIASLLHATFCVLQYSVCYALNFSVENESIHRKEAFLYSSKEYVYDAVSASKKNILLIPGASYSSKCYPKERFVELTRKIDANHIIIWGNDRHYCIYEHQLGIIRGNIF